MSVDAAQDPGAPPPGRALVAMSGGVDSALAAALLQRAGWEVAGVTLKLFCYGEEEPRDRACCGLGGVRDAQRVAGKLGISHVVLDFSDLFHERVIGDFVQEYARGRTPSPCVECNAQVKFAPLLDWARRQGFAALATGHYARLGSAAGLGASGPLLRRAAPESKDQSYVLWGLPERVLPFLLFPLGDLGKEAVRAEARRMDLPVWDKEESQDLCFVDDRGYAEVLRSELGENHAVFQPGLILDGQGRVLGRHEGIAHFTVGQRRGLSLGGPEAHYVTALDPANQVVRAGSADDLARTDLVASSVNLFVDPRAIEARPVDVQIRYRHKPVPGTALYEGGRLLVRFDQPQRAVAPGQSCVLYRDGWLLAGGKIE